MLCFLFKTIVNGEIVVDVINVAELATEYSLYSLTHKKTKMNFEEQKKNAIMYYIIYNQI